MRAVHGWHLLAQGSWGAPSQPSPPHGICLGGPVVSQPTRWGINCDLDPDKASGISPVVGESLASVQKWVCPRFRFIIRNHRTQVGKAGRDGGGHLTEFLPSRERGCGEGVLAPRSRPGLSLGGCPFCRWAGGICRIHR